jgi:molecular chaperone DnaK
MARRRKSFGVAANCPSSKRASPRRREEPCRSRNCNRTSSDDKRKRELADLRNNAEGLIYTTEKSLEEYSHVVTPNDVAEIQADVENLKGLMKQEDPAKLKEALQRLESSAYRIADAIYADGAKSSA